MANAVPCADLKAEYAETKPEIDQAVQRVLESGWFILGPELESFEHEFAAFCGARYALGVGSGTDALYLALKALGIGPGDEVITVAHTFIATALAITFTGATPVFVDIDPETYTMDSECARGAITSHTKVVLPVHLYGQMADMETLMALAEKHNLAVVEDASQAHGATHHGRKAGAIGHIGCFSFYPTKNLGAFGDGGAVVTHDTQLADRLAALRNYGQKQKYYHSTIGTNSRLDEMQAAVLRVKLHHLEANNQRRRQVAAAYARLDNAGLHLPVEVAGRSHIYHQYVIRSDQRDPLRLYLKENGIDTLIHYPVPVHRQEAYVQAAKVVHDLKITEQVAETVLSLPMYPQISASQIEAVTAALQKFHSRRSVGNGN